MKIRSVCVIGGSGFLGSHIVNVLATRGLPVRIPTRNRDRAKHELILLPTADVTTADVHDPETLRRLVAGADAVISLVGVLDGRHDGFRRNHVELPRRIVAACRDEGVKRLVHVSSLGASADAPSEYQRSKAEGESEIAAAAQYDIRTTIFRPSVVFGRGDHFLSLFARLARALPVIPLGCAGAKFQPIHVEDVARALVTSLDNPDAFGQRYDLCGPKVYTLRELVEYACALLGLERAVVPLPDKLAWLQAAVLEHLPGRLMTRDNVLSMQVDNVCRCDFPAVFGFAPAALEAIAPTYLAERTPRSRYRGFRYRAGR
ncbi:MAG: complex I NDUFA9 subunit family protein [Betaproteobacteria bacterium]